MSTPALYHFTCDHGRTGISKTQQLRPHVHPFMRNLGPLLWLTDLSEPSKEDVGLTNTWTTCDRLAYRYIVRTGAAIHWFEVRARAPHEMVATLESFGQPERWWIARRPLLASEFVLDTAWRREALA